MSREEHKRERMIQALTKDWNYNQNVIEDAYDVVNDYDMANEILEFMSSEGFETVIETLEDMFEYSKNHTFSSSIIEDDCIEHVLQRLRNT